MKKLLPLLLAVLICTGAMAQATEKQPILASIKLSPANFFGGEFLPSFEKGISDNASISIYAGLTAAEESNYLNASKVFGLRGELQFRKYLAPESIGNSGFYGGVYGFYRNIQLNQYINQICIDFPCPPGEEKQVTAYTTGGGVMVGYQLSVADIVVLDAFIGGGVKYSETSPNIQTFRFDRGIPGFQTTGVVPKAGASIGVLIHKN